MKFTLIFLLFAFILAVHCAPRSTKKSVRARPVHTATSKPIRALSRSSKFVSHQSNIHRKSVKTTTTRRPNRGKMVVKKPVSTISACHWDGCRMIEGKWNCCHFFQGIEFVARMAKA
ncbi:unnamed protein product, partial [Mesorhabditis belari]|uniref:Uncharacterized protein n=1 Tax=Mesorhabditis belari TaxID=2138241 RepID=A0AAF3J7F3_9BILA